MSSDFVIKHSDKIDHEFQIHIISSIADGGKLLIAGCSDIS